MAHWSRWRSRWSGWLPSRLALYPAVALVGLLLGAVDATMNMQGVAVQARYGRSLLASFHAAWSVGGILGALAARRLPP